MTTEKAIEMIDEYLLEPNDIDKAWVEVLEMCKKALLDSDHLKEEIERLNIRNKALTAITKNYDWKFAKAKAEAIKEFVERLTNTICEKLDQSSDNPDGNNYHITDVYTDIDNLVKETIKERF
jgi:hypothetical protein